MTAGQIGCAHDTRPLFPSTDRPRLDDRVVRTGPVGLMAAYDYRCEHDGVFELSLPLGTAPSSAPCPECGEEAPRIFAAPLTTPPGLDRSGPFGMTRVPAPPGARPPGGQPPMTAPMRSMPKP